MDTLWKSWSPNIINFIVMMGGGYQGDMFGSFRSSYYILVCLLCGTVMMCCHFYNSWGVWYLLSYQIHHFRDCLMIWGHLIWLRGIFEQCVLCLICRLILINLCVLSAPCFHLVGFRPCHVVQGRCLFLVLWRSWGGCRLRCRLWLYCRGVVLKMVSILWFLLLVNFFWLNGLYWLLYY